jgi:hypothetical protein
MSKLAAALAVALTATLAFAADDKSPGSTDTTGKAAATGSGDTYLAKEFWTKNAKDGYLSKDDVARFKGADGKGVDMQKLDLDNDGRVSEREWNAYQQTAGAAGKTSNAAEPSSTSK